MKQSAKKEKPLQAATFVGSSGTFPNMSSVVLQLRPWPRDIASSSHANTSGRMRRSTNSAAPSLRDGASLITICRLILLTQTSKLGSSCVSLLWSALSDTSDYTRTTSHLIKDCRLQGLYRFVCLFISSASPLILFSSLFPDISPPLLIFFFENRPAPFPGD